MTNDKIHLDPIADGPPPHLSKLKAAFIAVWVASALGNFHQGNWTLALMSALLALELWESYRTRRKEYFRGYKKAVKSVATQLGSDVEVDDE